MPTYQYACTACDERLEAVQSFTDAPLTQCPACGGALRKVFSAVGVVFKGSGFYKTDSRPAAKTADGSASDSSTSETKAETKSSGDAAKPAAASSGASSSGSSSSSSSPSSSAPASKSA